MPVPRVMHGGGLAKIRPIGCVANRCVRSSEGPTQEKPGRPRQCVWGIDVKQNAIRQGEGDSRQQRCVARGTGIASHHEAAAPARATCPIMSMLVTRPDSHSLADGPRWFRDPLANPPGIVPPAATSVSAVFLEGFTGRQFAESGGWPRGHRRRLCLRLSRREMRATRRP